MHADRDPRSRSESLTVACSTKKNSSRVFARLLPPSILTFVCTQIHSEDSKAASQGAQKLRKPTGVRPHTTSDRAMHSRHNLQPATLGWGGRGVHIWKECNCSSVVEHLIYTLKEPNPWPLQLKGPLAKRDGRDLSLPLPIRAITPKSTDQ